MKLNTTSDIPLFEQLKNDLLEQIKKGIYISGQQIPTETELSELYHVSRITIRRAITELCNEGVLIKKQGKGTFVKERKIFRKLEHTLSFSDACKTNQMEASTIVTKREVIPYEQYHLDNAKLFEGDSIVYIQRIRYADATPIMIENNYYPCQKFSFLLTEPLDGSLYQLFRENYDICIGCSQNSYIDAVKASTEQANLLHISPGDPLFLFHTEMYDIHNELIHIGYEYICGSKYRFCYDNS